MWRWVVLWQASAVLLAGATIDFGFFNRRLIGVPSTRQNCIDYTPLAGRHIYTAGFRTKRMVMSQPLTQYYPPAFPLLNTNEILARRIDRLLPNAEDIVKEHAKLVQDINGLKQFAYVKPLVEENRDYEDSIFHDTIEILTTPRPVPKVTTARATTPRPTKASSIPIILLGGASQQELVRSPPMKFSKPINLVGTSVSPLMKHPYPFVVHGTQKPLKICMNSVQMMYATTPRPGLLQRLLNSILPRGR